MIGGASRGFGRAIAAPQIGIPLRIVAMNLGRGPFLLVNPEISSRSPERFTLWDDCMSFPWLMVRVERHLRIDLDFCSETGEPRAWRNVDQAISELEQSATAQPNLAEYPAALGQAYLQKAGSIQDVREQGILGMKADQSFDAALALDHIARSLARDLLPEIAVKAS